MVPNQKPTLVKSITGNPGKRPLPQNEPQPTGEPVMPTFLSPRARAIWEEYAPRAYWLTEADSHALGAWCEMTVEVESSIATMDTSRITAWRVLGGELGFMCASRPRINAGKKRGSAADADPAEKYFNRVRSG